MKRRRVKDAWFVYLLRCGDGSLYTGIAKDVAERLSEHEQGKGAKYTRGRGPLLMLATAGPLSRGDALRLEIAIKRAPKSEKRTTLEAWKPKQKRASRKKTAPAEAPCAPIA